ncbi:MAG: hypothetical protein ACKO9V_04765, partial [Candidatus Kapaibacterium sp.]
MPSDPVFRNRNAWRRVFLYHFSMIVSGTFIGMQLFDTGIRLSSSVEQHLPAWVQGKVISTANIVGQGAGTSRAFIIEGS